MEPQRAIAKRIVHAEQKKCRGESSGCIRNIREGDCGRAGGALIDAISCAIEDARNEGRQEAAEVIDMLTLCGECGGKLDGETYSQYLRRLIDRLAVIRD